MILEELLVVLCLVMRKLQNGFPGLVLNIFLGESLFPGLGIPRFTILQQENAIFRHSQNSRTLLFIGEMLSLPCRDAGCQNDHAIFCMIAFTFFATFSIVCSPFTSLKMPFFL